MKVRLLCVLTALVQLGTYSASKHAIEAIAQTLKQELAEFGIHVATINPGPYKTGFNNMMFEDLE
ncbi:SDR family NAD(P)-dependent oxidoreductase [Paenibacillus borealis]|uniref:SDR family NAD(P)-dependent oxidoreductase n=1 Tax=Paenibacillus borealis TaxID=160799 RepID=UPI00316AE251